MGRILDLPLQAFQVGELSVLVLVVFIKTTQKLATDPFFYTGRQTKIN
jgi:hypothetical protein